MTCAGKKLHDIFFAGVSSKEKDGILQRFQVECKLLSELRHPHVVQFLGIYYERSDSDIPLLVMEYLPMTLANRIERCAPNRLPDEIAYSILYEVALGLRYLHQQSPPIIHRDLSANNVLLTHDMTAKISDLGVAKILDLTSAKKKNPLTTGPGTPMYMPPEARATPPKYSIAVDVFSYGVLILHIFSGKWPEPIEPVTIDPLNIENLIPKTEAQRREEYFQDMELSHQQLVEFTKRCLHNHPIKRPDDVEVIEVIEALVPPSLDKVQLIEGMKELKATNSMLHTELAKLEQQLKTPECTPLERERSIAHSLSLSSSRQSLTSDSGEQTKLPPLTKPVHHSSPEVNNQHGEVVSSHSNCFYCACEVGHWNWLLFLSCQVDIVRCMVHTIVILA